MQRYQGQACAEKRPCETQQEGSHLQASQGPQKKPTLLTP